MNPHGFKAKGVFMRGSNELHIRKDCFSSETGYCGSGASPPLSLTSCSASLSGSRTSPASGSLTLGASDITKFRVRHHELSLAMEETDNATWRCDSREPKFLWKELNVTRWHIFTPTQGHRQQKKEMCSPNRKRTMSQMHARANTQSDGTSLDQSVAKSTISRKPRIWTKFKERSCNRPFRSVLEYETCSKMKQNSIVTSMASVKDCERSPILLFSVFAVHTDK